MKTTKNTAAGAGIITMTVKDAETLYTYLCKVFDQRITNEIMDLVNDDKNWVLVASEDNKQVRVLSASTLVEILNIVHKYEELKAFYKENLDVELKAFYKENLDVSPESYIQYVKSTKSLSDLIDRHKTDLYRKTMDYQRKIDKHKVKEDRLNAKEDR